MHLSKRIRLSDEAYERLAAHKRDDETFSDVVMRLAGEPSLLELAGILTDEQAGALEAAIEERRERRAGELDAVANRMTNYRVTRHVDYRPISASIRPSATLVRVLRLLSNYCCSTWLKPLGK